MGLLSDALRHLIGSSAADRRAGLRGLLAPLFRVEPVVVRHPSIPADLPFDLVSYRTPPDGSRRIAVTMTLGLSEREGRELIALTLANVKDPAADRFAWMLYQASQVSLGGVGALAEGTLGRSSHTHVAVVEPWPAVAFRGPELSTLVGARVDLALPITAREADFSSSRSAEQLAEIMREQGIEPWADRPAGQTDLGGTPG